MIIKKKVVYFHKIILIIFFFYLFILSSLNASQILDYETESFIKSVLEDIKKVNSINKDINFIIINDDSINAYVNEKNIIFITSGLIENCKDYVAFLSVLAHEVGHIDKNHVSQRKLNINKLNQVSKFSNLSIIAGSLLSNNPELIQGIALSSASSSNYYINFTKDQEREADYYSLKTLSKLNLYSNSIIELLELIEKKSLEKGITKDKMKISTHPYFEERINIINYLNQKNSNKLNIEKNYKFNFIKAKFLGFGEKREAIKFIDEPFKSYAFSIIDAKEGKLKNSMKKINKVILNNENNIFLLETKADILFSYGYTNEAIKFYKKVTSYYENNYYSQIRILENTDIEILTKKEREIFFNKNLNLLQKFYNNKNILIIYLNLAKNTQKTEWEKFLSYWINKNNDVENIKKVLEKFKDTQDKDLLKIINLIYNDIL